MALAERVLKYTFSDPKSGSFSAAGLRSAAIIQAYPERQGSVGQVKIWGLSLDQMNSFSSTISGGVGAEMFRLTVEAGDFGGPLSTVLDGLILRSFIDLSSVPDSAFNVNMIDTFSAATPIESQSQPGAQNAEDLIASLCVAGGLTFDNSAAAHAVLSNQSTSGSVIDQIATIARAAGFTWKIVSGKLSIWPMNGLADSTVVNVGPNTDPQMVGYPGWWEAGLIVTSLYNPNIQIGRQVNVVGSMIPKANGQWLAIQVEHSLTTMLAKGPWFTTAYLSTLGSP